MTACNEVGTSLGGRGLTTLMCTTELSAVDVVTIVIVPVSAYLSSLYPQQ